MDKLDRMFKKLSLLDEEELNSTVDDVNNLINLKIIQRQIHTGEKEEFDGYSKLARFTSSVIGSFAHSVLVESRYGKFIVPIQDQGVGFELRTKGTYADREIEHIRGIINEDTSVLMIGAHVGSILVPISQVCRDVTAIEANPDTFELLKLNLFINNIQNCEVHNLAASDKQEMLKFLKNTVNSGGSKRKPLISEYMYTYDDPEEIIVEGMSMDIFLESRSFDLIIMDIEGSEYFALQGMTRLLDSCQTLIFEFVPHHLKNISGVTVESFSKLLAVFDTLTIPSLNIKVTSESFLTILNYLYEHNICEDGVIMEKN